MRLGHRWWTDNWSSWLFPRLPSFRDLYRRPPLVPSEWNVRFVAPNALAFGRGIELRFCLVRELVEATARLRGVDSHLDHGLEALR
jgi:hypothetical protein